MKSWAIRVSAYTATHGGIIPPDGQLGYRWEPMRQAKYHQMDPPDTIKPTSSTMTWEESVGLRPAAALDPESNRRWSRRPRSVADTALAASCPSCNRAGKTATLPLVTRISTSGTLIPLGKPQPSVPSRAAPTGSSDLNKLADTGAALATPDPNCERVPSRAQPVALTILGDAD